MRGLSYTLFPLLLLLQFSAPLGLARHSPQIELVYRVPDWLERGLSPINAPLGHFEYDAFWIDQHPSCVPSTGQ